MSENRLCYLRFARGRVVKPGRAPTVCVADVIALADGAKRPVAAMLATLMALLDRPHLPRGP
jgi:acyl-coenzyme A thioesterase PaaI-like protein